MSTLGLPWLDSLRERGKARFAETGLPSRKDEAWKFTGLNKLRALGLEPSPVHTKPSKAPAPLVAGATHRLVFVDGRFDATLSDVGALPTGTIVGSLSDVLAHDPAKVEPLLGRLADSERRPMVALNSAWIEDGLVVILPDRAVLDRPIELVFGGAGVSHPRHLIALGKTAEAILVERHLGGDEGGFMNGIAEIALGVGSTLQHYVMHAEPETMLSTATQVVSLDRDASYRGFVFTVGGGLVRHEVEARLMAPGASCHIDGAYLVDGHRHADVTALIEHRAPHCSSRQTQKGVVDGAGHAVFQGKVKVDPGAQKTDANQLSQTLLLSREAEIDVKPELEIYADDVKCSHGATSGRLDESALFYLRARGIPEQAARGLLIQGFIDGALDEIDHQPVRDAFKAAAASWLAEHAAPQAKQSESTP